MNDLISRQAAIDALDGNVTVTGRSNADAVLGYANLICDRIKRLPSADVQPVRHGHWETIEGWDGDELYRCSECGAEFVLIDGTPKDNDYWFCPHCGADMRGEQYETD